MKFENCLLCNKLVRFLISIELIDDHRSWISFRQTLFPAIVFTKITTSLLPDNPRFYSKNVKFQIKLIMAPRYDAFGLWVSLLLP